MTTPAPITDAMIARAIRVGKSADLPLVEVILPKGVTLRYHLRDGGAPVNPADLVDP